MFFIIHCKSIAFKFNKVVINNKVCDINLTLQQFHIGVILVGHFCDYFANLCQVLVCVTSLWCFIWRHSYDARTVFFFFFFFFSIFHLPVKHSSMLMAVCKICKH